MTPHQARVRAAVGRFMARNAPAGYFPLNALFDWITAAGSLLHCGRCGTEAVAPLPRRDPAGYSTACEDFVAAHRRCREGA